MDVKMEKWVLAGLIIIALLVSIGVYNLLVLNQSMPSSPAPLYELVEPVSLEEFLLNVSSMMHEENVVLKLPTWMPNDYHAVAVWYKLPFVAVIAYDEHPVKNYDEAEITVQITLLSSSFPRDKSEARDILMKEVENLVSNGREASLIEVDEFYVVLVKNSRNSFIAYVYDLDGGFRYVIFAKNLSLPDEMLNIIASMDPVKL